MSAKKLIALLLAFVLCTGILAGCNTQPQETTNSTTKATEGTTKATEGTTAPVEVEYTRPDLEGATIVTHFASTTVAEGDCFVDKAVQDLLNCNWDVLAGANWAETTLPMIAEGKVPDLIGRNSYGAQEIQLGEEGAFINYYDYLDQMPNVKAFLENPAYADYVKQYTVREGVMYCLPIEREVDTNIWGFNYRADIFEKHGLEWPTNQEEFYNVLVKLKDLYPDSYPFVLRPQSADQLSLRQWAYCWGCYWAKTPMPDGNGGYYYGLVHDGAKELAQFIKKLNDEGLLHPSSTTLDTAAFNEIMATGESFVCFEKTGSAVGGKKMAQELNPEWKVVGGEVFPMGTYGVAATSAAGKTTPVSYAIGNNDNVENTIKFVDWMYSPEGIEVTNWGVEGVSYEIDADGNKHYFTEWLEGIDFGLSGLNKHFMCALTTWDSYADRSDPVLIDSMERLLPYKYQAPANPNLAMYFTEDEQIVIDTYEASAYTYAFGEYMKFCLGQRDIAEWDAYVKEVEAYSIDKLIEVYTAAYQRYLEAQA